MAEDFKTRIFNTGWTPHAALVSAATFGPAAFLLRHLIVSANFIRHHEQVGSIITMIDGGLATLLIGVWVFACVQNVGKSLRISVEGVGYYHKDRDYFQADWKETVVRYGPGVISLETPRGVVRLYALFFPQFGRVRHAVEDAQLALRVREQRSLQRLVEQAEQATSPPIKG